jgi:hypothetical protein
LRLDSQTAEADADDIMSNLDGTDVSANAPSFTFFDSDGWKFEQFGPLTAGDGFARKDFIGKADRDNPDNQTVGFTFLKVPESWKS